MKRDPGSQDSVGQGSRTIIFDGDLRKLMILEITTSEIIIMSGKPISERRKPQASSSERSGCSSTGIPASPMLRYIVTALFGLLALPGLGWTQTALRTPAADDPP